MKKNILITLTILSFGTFLYSSTIQPTISMRYNDVVNSNNDLTNLTTVLVLGFGMDVGDGVSAGFDSDGTDSRIFVSFDYGTMGMGMNANGDPQFTIGAKYSALSNLDVSLDYIINNLTTDNGGDPSPNELRMSLGVTF
tara:strand:- start:76 stop:492 length:417 start_codon:yes stop_codon:yes gene_type:complete